MNEIGPVARPWWVKVTLWGLRGRASALFFVWLCVGLATAFVFLGFKDRRYSLGAVWLLAALGYLRASAGSTTTAGGLESCRLPFALFRYLLCTSILCARVATAHRPETRNGRAQAWHADKVQE